MKVRTTWITLMGSDGITVLALAVAGPAAQRTAPVALARITTRLALAAAALSVLAVPAVLSNLAHGFSQAEGYDYAAAWGSLYGGGSAGVLSGPGVTFSLAGAALLAALAFHPVAASRARGWLLGGGLAAGAVALGTTKFPTDLSDGWGRTIFETGVWMLHLFGGAIWIGGLAGLLLLALPGGAAVAGRGAFWSAVVRRFETIAVIAVMIAGYRVSGRLTRSRAKAVAATATNDPEDFVGA